MEIKRYVVEVNEQGQVQGQPVPYIEKPAVIVKEGITLSGAFDWIIILAGLAVLAFFSIVIVKEKTVEIIERLGKFKKVATAGVNFKIPFIDWVVKDIDLKIQQLNVNVETKTKDNVFVSVPVAVQYYVVPEKAYEAYYKLDNPEAQIKSYVFDTVRAQIPKMDLDEVFEKKEDVATKVKEELKGIMDDFGYGIITALVTDIDPAPKVKEAMNEINAQQRFRVASIEKGEGEKTLIVKKAEAEAESKILQGKGIAGQRKAIIEGMKASVEDMTEATGISSTEVMNLVLLTQYFDTIKEVGDKGNSMVFLPSSPEGMSNLSNEIRTAILSSKK